MTLPGETPQLTAQCRLPSGRHIELTVLDLSLCGCMIDRRGWSAGGGERVLMKFPGLAFLPATVLWAEGERAGLTFEEPLYEPVFENLRQSLAQAL